MKIYARKICATAAVTASAIVMTSAVMASEKINIALFKYPSAEARVQLVKILLEERFGLEVDTVTGDHATFYAGMDRGNGDIDIHPEVWQPNQSNFKDEYVDEKGSVEYSEKFVNATSGFCVPKFFSEEQNVKSIFDLGRPEIAKQLDTDGDGRGDIYIGKSGWASTNENHVKVRDYGLLAFNDYVKADPAVNVASLDNAVKNREGYAFYCSKPGESVWIQYEIVELEEPPYDPSCYNLTKAKGNPEWFEKSKITCKGKPKTISVGWSKSLDQRVPGLTDLLRNIEFDADTMSEWSYEIGEKKRSPREVVEEWIAANPTQVDSWFGL